MLHWHEIGNREWNSQEKYVDIKTNVIMKKIIDIMKANTTSYSIFQYFAE